jgi:hypothetical protein
VSQEWSGPRGSTRLRAIHIDGEQNRRHHATSAVGELAEQILQHASVLRPQLDDEPRRTPSSGASLTLSS